MWTQLLEGLVTREEENNIEDQTLYINILSMLCRDHNEEGVRVYQIECLKEILQSNNKIALDFGTDNENGPYFRFPKKSEKTIQGFFSRNPRLGKFARTGANPTDINNVVFYLVDLSKNHQDTLFYIKYVCAVLNLYANMCLSRYRNAVKLIKEKGLRYDHIYEALYNPNVHYKFKESYYFIARVLLIDIDPYFSVLKTRNRCY